jgi:hypothetical protein
MRSWFYASRLGGIARWFAAVMRATVAVSRILVGHDAFQLSPHY